MHADRKAHALAQYAVRTRIFDRIAQKRVRLGGPELMEPTPVPAGVLSSREVEVLQLIAEGLSDREIGTRLFITEYTVKSHVKKVLAKLGSRNRAHAAASGYRLGLL
jgi:DNA-binding NarL/FixJ family response regulator